MEKKAYFLKHLGNGNIMTITDMNRKYCETIVKIKREYILLDEPLNNLDISISLE